MKTHLKINHLAPYLPYGLKIWHIGWECQLTMNATGDGRDYSSIDDVNSYAKPILRPLSDLTKEIEYNGEKFIPIERLNYDFNRYGENGFDFSNLVIPPISYPYYIVQKLFEWHFDVFDLHSKGLAIDLNTL